MKVYVGQSETEEIGDARDELSFVGGLEVDLSRRNLFSGSFNLRTLKNLLRIESLNISFRLKKHSGKGRLNVI